MDPLLGTSGNLYLKAPKSVQNLISDFRRKLLSNLLRKLRSKLRAKHFRAKGALTSKFADNHSTLFGQCRFTSSRNGHRARNSSGRLQKYSNWGTPYYQLTKLNRPNPRQYIARWLTYQQHCVTDIFHGSTFGDFWRHLGTCIWRRTKSVQNLLSNLRCKLLSKTENKTFSRQRRTYVQISRQPQYSFWTMSVYKQSKWTPCAKF